MGRGRAAGALMAWLPSTPRASLGLARALTWGDLLTVASQAWPLSGFVTWALGRPRGPRPPPPARPHTHTPPSFSQVTSRHAETKTLHPFPSQPEDASGGSSPSGTSKSDANRASSGGGGGGLMEEMNKLLAKRWVFQPQTRLPVRNPHCHLVQSRRGTADPVFPSRGASLRPRAQGVPHTLSPSLQTS